MKKIASILFILASILVIVGAFFKIMHYAGSAEIMMTGFLTAAAAFILSLWASRRVKQKS